jgi:hypothetical protein
MEIFQPIEESMQLSASRPDDETDMAKFIFEIPFIWLYPAKIC